MKRYVFLNVAAVLALGFTAVSCSHDHDYYEPKDAAQEFKKSFEAYIMDGETIDPGQTWNTAEAVTLTVKTDQPGTIKVYTANPMGRSVAPLTTQKVVAGDNKVVVAKPADAKTLYVSMVDGYYAEVQTVQDGEARFERTSSSAGARRAAARAPQAPTLPNWEFANAPTDADFAYTALPVPSDALLVTEYGDATKNTVHNYKLADVTYDQYTNLYAGNFNLYVEGTKRINYGIPGDGQKNMHIYIMPNANVTFTQNFTQKGAGELFMHIPSSATVTFEQGLQAYMTLYNRGTVIVKGGYKPGIYDGGVFYNEGTFTVNGAQDYYFGNKNNANPLTLNNGDSQFINAGTLNIGALTLEGSSHFLNLGTVNCSGNTVVNSNFCTWVNEGQYTTQYYLYHAGSTDVRNNCHLTVTEMFTINLGDTDKNNFTNNAGANVVAKNFEFQGPGYIKMGANSLFKVEQTATMNITKEDYGFWGPDSGTDYAVLQARDVVSGQNNSKYVTYGGNLFVAADSHFANGWSGQYQYYYLKDNAKIANGQNAADYSIRAGRCSPGYNDNGSIVPPAPEPMMYYYYAFEDLGGVEGVNQTDIDFNDIIIRVSAPVDGACTAELVAAGGRLSTKIAYDGNVIVENAHTKMDAMSNTENVDVTKFVPIADLTGITDASDLPFSIIVDRQDGAGNVVSTTVEAVGLGEAPLMIKVSGIAEGENAGKWFWVKERRNIKTAYTDFSAWASNRVLKTDWYKRPATNVVSY